MKKLQSICIATMAAAICLSFGFASPTVAQVGELPHVTMVGDNFDYMISLFPDAYPERRQAIKACSTIVPAAESLQVFWHEQGDAVLYYLSFNAGIDWIEPEFTINLVKYYPDYACHRPMTIPLAGKKNGDRIVALQQGLSHYITLFQQLSKRLLEQVQYPGSTPLYINNHPLLQKTPRRFDNMANLLALKTMGEFFNIDSVLAVFKSAQWREREVGQEVLFDNFWDTWNFSPDTTLASLIAAEPYGSRLVALTRRPATPRPSTSRNWGNHQLQAPPGGKIGLSVAKDRSGFFRVVDVDSLKLGYLSGLRKDDLIRNIEGKSPRNIKQLFTYILEYLETGAHVSIVRDGEPDAVIIYPWE